MILIDIMEEDGAQKFESMNGCSEKTNAIIARYRMFLSLLENEQDEHAETQAETHTEIDKPHQEEIIEDPVFEINIIENPNRTMPRGK